LLIKDAIDIVITTLTVTNSPEARRDGRRLKEIQLTEDEWDLMKDLVDILGPFFETEELGGSEYITISYILTSILALIRNLANSINHSADELSDELNDELSDEELSEEVNFETNDLAFDNNIGFIDAKEEEEQGPKKRKININTPTNTKNMKHKIKNALYNALLHYWDLSDSDALLACLLDLRCKKLKFASPTQKRQAETTLYDKYNNLKSLHQSSTPSDKPLSPHNDQDNQEEQHQIYQKSFFKTIFMQDTPEELNDELGHYLSLPEIHYKSNPFNWWNSQKASFPVLTNLARQYLATPATSTPSERLFSDASNTMMVRRTMLKPKLFERMLILSNSLLCIKFL